MEALVVGPEPIVDDLIERCRIGPEAARVDNIAIESPDAPDAGDSFEKRPTL